VNFAGQGVINGNLRGLVIGVINKLPRNKSLVTREVRRDNPYYILALGKAGKIDSIKENQFGLRVNGLPLAGVCRVNDLVSQAFHRQIVSHPAHQMHFGSHMLAVHRSGDEKFRRRIIYIDHGVGIRRDAVFINGMYQRRIDTVGIIGGIESQFPVTVSGQFHLLVGATIVHRKENILNIVGVAGKPFYHNRFAVVDRYGRRQYFRLGRGGADLNYA